MAANQLTASALEREDGYGLAPAVARALLLLIVAFAAVAGFLATGADASHGAVLNAGEDLTRLLRAMTGLKLMMAAAAAAVVLWRLAAPVTGPWLAAYAAGCAAMAFGPGLIWSMAHVGSGALLLHAGLLATVVLLWRDPAMAGRLAALVAARRAARTTLARR